MGLIKIAVDRRSLSDGRNLIIVIKIRYFDPLLYITTKGFSVTTV